MKIRITFDLDKLMRRALNHRVGNPGLASYARCRAEIMSLIESDLDIILQDYQDSGEYDESEWEDES